MTYRIARHGQTFGPYSEGEIRQYIASGNIGATDYVQAEGAAEWLTVAQVFPVNSIPFAPVSATKVAAPAAVYPDPPDLPWWAALLIGLVTGGVFFVVWDIVQAAWLKRIEKDSTALLWYIGVAVMYLFKLPSMWSTMNFNIFGGPNLHTHGGTLGGLSFVLAIVARFVFRRELLDHFNQREGIPLRLSGLWTLVFGGVYFQWHFNRINELKRASNTSMSAA